MSKKMEEIDHTIDQLLENAKMLHCIENDPQFALEKKALEGVQESLYHHLLSLKISEEDKKEIKQAITAKSESVFFAPQRRIRGFRMKQAVERR